VFNKPLLTERIIAMSTTVKKDLLSIKRLRNSSPNIYISFIGMLCAIAITFFVLFNPPVPGVADQGDFGRVMTAAGLEDKSPSPDYYSRWYKYVTAEYAMDSVDLLRLTGIIPATSTIYPVTLARLACKMFGMEYFNTKALAFIYAILYIFSLFTCFRYLKFKEIATAIFFVMLALLILMDGNYLIWFNSLYGEPTMIISLIMFSASILYIAANINQTSPRIILLVFISAFLFLGAKMQCFSALPFIALLILRVIQMYNKQPNKPKIKTHLTVFTLLLTYYVGGIYLTVNHTCGVDTEFNSVFYGILKNSKDPQGDLKALGLSTDLALEIGKHAYLPSYRYVKYVPRSPLTTKEFNNKMSNFKLLRFYLLNPDRFIDGMKYTSSKIYDTRGLYLGKFEKSDVPEIKYFFDRFTLWSGFRVSKLPKSLFFLIFFYFSVIVVSIIEYIRKKTDTSWRLRIELLWLIMIIGLVQFPMPYIGNGEADTSKQLFLFNFTFDIVLLSACTWCFDRVYSIGKKLMLSLS
jgi:hypothetical protein